MPHDTREPWHDQPIPALATQFSTDVQRGLTLPEAAQRLPAYSEYMEEVPRFVPRLWRRQSYI